MFLSVIDLLIKAGVDLNVVDNFQNSAVMLSAYPPGDPVITEMLINNGANLEQKNDDGWTALHFAVRFGFIETVKLVIPRLKDLNMESYEHMTPVGVACLYGKLECLEILLAAGADPNHKSDCGCTPLHWAILQLEPQKQVLSETVAILLRNGATQTVNTKDIKGWTALRWAIKHLMFDVGKLLLAAGAEVEADDIQLAVRTHHVDFANLLRDHLRKQREAKKKMKIEEKTDEKMKKKENLKVFKKLAREKKARETSGKDGELPTMESPSPPALLSQRTIPDPKLSPDHQELLDCESSVCSTPIFSDYVEITCLFHGSLYYHKNCWRKIKKAMGGTQRSFPGCPIKTCNSVLEKITTVSSGDVSTAMNPKIKPKEKKKEKKNKNFE